MAEAMPGTSPQPTMQDFAAFEQLRAEVSPSEFNETLLSTAAEADPVAVAEFKAELRGLDLPVEVLDVLDNMVEEILASPERYVEIRDHYKTQNMPEDLLPEIFDAEFFVAFNLALDEIRSTSGADPLPPQSFAKGGVASLRPIAAAMAQQGRHGDTMLAHITPREAGVLRRMGGSGTINPTTGLPEFFNPLKSIGKAFKKIGKAIKKFARSTIGKIVISTALFFIAGPAAAAALGVQSAAGVAAVSGFVAGAGSSLAAGASLKDSLKAGAIGGIAAGAFTGITQGADAFKAPTAAPVVESVAETIVAPDLAVASESLASAPTTVSPGIPATNTGAGITSAPIGGAPPGTVSFTPASQQVPGFSLGAETSMASPTAGVESVMPSLDTTTYVSNYPQSVMDQGVASLPPVVESTADYIAPQSFTEKLTSLPGKAWDKISPQAIENRAIAASGEAYQPAYDAAFLQHGDKAAAQAAGIKAVEAAASPSLLSKYGPLAGVGLGVMGLSGGFNEQQPEIPAGWEDIMAGGGGQALLDQYPDIYGLRFGGVNTISQSNPFPTYNAAKGSGPAGVDPQNFPRKNGPINGPGTGTSDDVPAMLSDGEFVFTAKAVRNMGNGSRRKGAKKMYALMKKLEGAANG